MPSLTDHEKARIRHHLGYVNVGSVHTFSLGVPAAIEPMFMLEAAMDAILPAAEDTVRQKIAVLDQIEAQMVGDLELLAVERVDEISINKDEQKMLTDRYRYWQMSLANDFRCEPNRWDFRFGGSMGANVRVQH